MKKLMLVAALGLVATQAAAQDKLKVGILTTLSGPPAALGQQQRNGFQLALKTLGGKLGGREVELVVQDDELKPDVAVSKAKAFVERDKVDFVVGPIFSNILHRDHEAGDRWRRVPDSPECRHLEFRRQGVQPELLRHLVPERPEPRGAGQIRAGQRHQEGVHHGAELSGRQGLARRLQALLQGRGRSTKSTSRSTSSTIRPSCPRSPRPQPEAIFVFLPGGMGVNFVKQFRQAGLADKIKFLSAFTVDESTLPAQQDAALGFFGGANWAPNLDNPQNKAFVAAYEKEYNARARRPTRSRPMTPRC